MTVRDTIVEKLSRKFSPTHLDVIDESNSHFGHAGWREGGETHFRVRIAASQLAGLSRVTQHRAIMEALAEELDDRVHALAIEVRAEGAVDIPKEV
jgi:BolA family transcriptional regulator, general stress-responsive regulator